MSVVSEIGFLKGSVRSIGSMVVKNAFSIHIKHVKSWLKLENQ
jgi:hypothetical protein